MAITKANFYKQGLNQFMPNRVRGEKLDWGLAGEVIEAQIDVTQETPLYAGDPVKIVATSKGKLKVAAGASTDKFVGYIIFNPKHETFKAGDIVSILLRGAVMSFVTEEAIDAGAIVYYNDTDGSVTATQGSAVSRVGVTFEATVATEGGVLVPVYVG